MQELLNQPEDLNTVQAKILRYERFNLVWIYLNSMLFSALFTFESIPVFLVKAVFNGSGIIMVLGLLSLIIGNITASFRYSGERFPLFGSYYSTMLLFGLQVAFMVAIGGWLLVKIL